MRNSAFNLWKNKGLKEVLANGEGFIFFIFESPTCCSEVLKRGPWYIGVFYLILKKWTRMMRLTKDKIQKVPVWVKFFNVPMEYWDSDGLSRIASAVGIPLFMDHLTDKGTRGLPVKCERCSVFGHDTTKCVTTQVAKLVNLQKETENNPDPGWSIVKAKGKRKVGDPDPTEEEMGEPESREEDMVNGVARDASDGDVQVLEDVNNVQVSAKSNKSELRNTGTSAGTQNASGVVAVSSGKTMPPNSDGLADIQNELLDIAMLALPGNSEILEKVKNLSTSVESTPDTPGTLPARSTTRKSSGKGKGQRKKTS
ncbi:uncharacterized protein LOC114271647 [Camellia sinensis]|uniref:uncharacterized protein LOC114271647 n=1 Tax=Camellia sinensis TaxID=4442 RepID=UPI00103587E3|nr:uncharacterized protein LOC114271647 [Camellia sinensis]